MELTPQTKITPQPEFADHRTAKRLFGMSRSYLYKLVEERKIRSVSLRKKGALKGRRLFDCASIRQFINSMVEEAE
jgi:hypothetical protein